MRIQIIKCLLTEILFDGLGTNVEYPTRAGSPDDKSAGFLPTGEAPC